MNEKHYKEKLSRFVNHELAQDERQALAEHLLMCAECREEHDEIKFGAALASTIKQTDAPENLWNKIENSLNGAKKERKFFGLPNFAFFSLRGLTATAALLIVGALIYIAFSRESAPETVKNEPPAQNADSAMPPAAAPASEVVSSQTANQPAETGAANQSAPNINLPPANNARVADSGGRIPPKAAPFEPREVLPKQINPAAWNVETLAGMPTIGNSSENGKLAVGEVLETDADSRARVQVANIGNVEVAPNSRVKLVNTKSTEHRLALEKGTLKAKILAPPRLFIVDTPSGAAVDLGCEYTLEVDASGNSRLHVTSGFVALENGKFESIVPAGAIALTKKGKGVGTPFSEDATQKLQAALYKFDFENGGREALRTIITESSLYDSVTLWHLLARVEKSERAKVFDALAAQVKPPATVTRGGILRLDKKMLGAWWTEIETVWFE
jgi:anti-sigma factor RsiW